MPSVLCERAVAIFTHPLGLRAGGRWVGWVEDVWKRLSERGNIQAGS